MVPADSHRASPTPRYSGFKPSHYLYTYGTVTLYGPPFHACSFLVITFMSVLQPHVGRNQHGLGFFPFARHYLGNHYCFLFLQVLRCFSSLRSLLFRYLDFIKMGCPIRKSSDQRLFAPTRSLSQLTTSFFASECLGIPHILLFTFSSIAR